MYGQEVTAIWKRNECRLAQAILKLLCWNEGYGIYKFNVMFPEILSVISKTNTDKYRCLRDGSIFFLTFPKYSCS